MCRADEAGPFDGPIRHTLLVLKIIIIILMVIEKLKISEHTMDGKYQDCKTTSFTM